MWECLKRYYVSVRCVEMPEEVVMSVGKPEGVAGKCEECLWR